MYNVLNRMDSIVRIGTFAFTFIIIYVYRGVFGTKIGHADTSLNYIYVLFVFFPYRKHLKESTN